MSEKNEWKPIESAPKDGSEFLACYTRQGNVTQIVKWNTLHGHFASKGEWLPGFTANATHWMPLPAAPGSTSSAPGDAQDEQPYCYALETRGRHAGIDDVLLDVEYNGTDNFSGGRTGGIPLYRRPAPAAGDALATNDELLALLPGTYYMDPPDGGNAGVLEQLQRMAADAARYRWLKERNGGSIGIVAWHRDEEQEMVLVDEHADAAIDAALAAQVQHKGDAA